VPGSLALLLRTRLNQLPADSCDLVSALAVLDALAPLALLGRLAGVTEPDAACQSAVTEDCCGGHPEICGYTAGGVPHDDDLSQPELRDVAQRAGDDPKCGPGAAGHRVPEDAADS
jgi:hypothetical protein